MAACVCVCVFGAQVVVISAKPKVTLATDQLVVYGFAMLVFWVEPLLVGVP